jgi:hypothetical protein
VTIAGVGLKIRFIAHLEHINTIDYSANPNSHTLFLTLAHIRSSMSSLGAAWQRIQQCPLLPGSTVPILAGRSLPHNCQLLAGSELHALGADRMINTVSALSVLSRVYSLPQ